mgnify:CR=1 FL=1
MWLIVNGTGTNGCINIFSVAANERVCQGVSLPQRKLPIGVSSPRVTPTSSRKAEADPPSRFKRVVSCLPAGEAG